MCKNKFSLLILVSLLLAQFAVAQNNTNSPYTRFGYGDITDANSGEQRAMGGVALGSRSKTSINTINPASYSSVDSMTFLFDIGSSALFSRFTTTAGGLHKFTANLDYITMQFPLAKNVGFSAGLLPYSFVGYDFATQSEHKTRSTSSDFDTISSRNVYSGNGGFSQVYGGLSVNFLKHISLGVNAYYMFGTVNHVRGNRWLSASDSTVEYSSINANNFRFRYGAQFYNTFGDKHDVTLGLIYEHKANLNGTYSQVTYGTLTEAKDTTAADQSFQLPDMFGVGLYYTYDKRLSLGLDYTLQKFGDVKFRDTYALRDRSKLALGVEYLPNPRGRKFVQRMSYRAGFNMSDPYYNVNNVIPPKNYGVSLGFGFPLYNNVTQTVTMLNTSFEYGKIGSSELLREDYFKFTLNIVFNEHWFFKRKL